MLTEALKVTGDLKIEVRGPDGQIKDTREVKNLILTVGRNFIASRMVGTAQGAMSHMALGSVNTAPVVGNTTLASELGRTALTSSTATNNVVSYVGNFAAGVATGAITEAGIFNAGFEGTMLCRTVFSVINKSISDTMSITWSVTVN
jgi:hypothetical protein